MSQENVEVVRKAFEAWNAGDMGALAKLYDTDMLLRGPEEWPEAGPFFGRDAIMRQFEQVREALDSDELIPGDIIDVGDRVLVKAAWRGIGHGPELAMEWTLLYTLRKGKVILLEYFQDHTEALQAVGLSDQAMSQENMEVTRESFEACMDAINARDFDSLAELLGPKVEFGSVLGAAEGGAAYTGIDGLRKWAEEVDAIWEDWHQEVVDFREVSDTEAVAVIRATGKARGSGVPLDTRTGTC